MKVIELFAGIGSQTQALKNIEIEHEVVGIAEIDKHAVRSYEAIHGEANNLGDICKIEKLPHCDLLTYSFPCQDLSVAGKGSGIKEGTRSGLLLEVERLLEVSDKPKYLLMENVKNLVGKKNKPDFDRWCDKLKSMGYVNYWKVLNAKHYGIPQNRERVFMVSILGEHEPYIFPEGFDNGMRLKDLLEDEVDEKFYLSEKMLKYAFNFEKEAKGIGFSDGVDRSYINPDIAQTIGCRSAADQRSGTTNYVSDDRNKIRVSDWKQSIQKKIIIDDMQGGNRQPKRLSQYRIRKLTPLEVWRLMGFQDEHFRKAQNAGISNSQLYKQAGNSIVVDVLEHIFTNLFK